MIRLRIDDPILLRSWCIEETDESLLRVDPLILLMHHDPTDLESLLLIRIIMAKERTLSCSQVTFVGSWPLVEARCVCFNKSPL